MRRTPVRRLVSGARMLTTLDGRASRVSAVAMVKVMEFFGLVGSAGLEPATSCL